MILFSGTRNSVGLSDGSSSAGQSRFPLAASDDGEILATPNLRVYSFSDLNIATRGFNRNMILGEGGFGTLYKGWLDERTLSPSRSRSGMIVAIKKLNPENVLGVREWQVILTSFQFNYQYV